MFYGSPPNPSSRITCAFCSYSTNNGRMFTLSFSFLFSWIPWELNPQASRRRSLKPMRMPVPPGILMVAAVGIEPTRLSSPILSRSPHASWATRPYISILLTYFNLYTCFFISDSWSIPSSIKSIPRRIFNLSGNWLHFASSFGVL